MPHLIAALDAGTTSTRCLLFDAGGNIVASAQKEHRQITPQPGWLEHDPVELADNARAVCEQAVASGNVAWSDVAAIGVTNQRETFLLWDRRSGRPLHNAIVWSDARTSDLCETLKADGGIDRFRERTGLPIATYFSAGKYRWLLDHLPDARAAGRGEFMAGTVDAWLLWNLTGRPATDITNASRTQLMSLDSLAWDDDLCEAFDVFKPCLPPIQPSIGGDFGEAFGVPVAAVLGDQQAALFGQCCFDPGEAKNTYGTGCFLLMNTGRERVASTHGLLTTPACQVAGEPPTWALEGSVATAGSAVQWLRDNLGLIQSSADVEPLADSVDDSGGVVFVPALGGLFAPHWDATARGTVLGITQQTTAAHLARATLDATAYQSADVFDAMAADAGRSLAALNVDGGMAVNDRVLQFQADLLGVPVTRPAMVESTAAGAAYAAGLAVGFWKDHAELRSLRRPDRTFEPQMGAAERDRLRARWAKAVERSKSWTA